MPLPLLTELFAMTFNGIKPGLDRIEALCDEMGSPQNRLCVIHVAGTNGKGSTSAMLASIIQAAGYTVGLYTSPHISVFNERIRINGAMISDADIERLALPLIAHAKTIGGTFFEVTTALALAWFAERRVDVAVIETGLGGRLDATNIVSPMLSVITHIDLDHTEYLGNSLISIAKEKAGIVKKGAPVIVGSQQRNDVAPSTTVVADINAVFTKKAQEENTPITFADDVVHVEVDSIHPDLTMTVSAIRNGALEYYDVDIAGAHQAQNVATILAAVEQLTTTLFINDDHIREGLASIRVRTGLQGRIQLLRNQPPVILDVCHNPGGIEALRATLAQAGYPEQGWHVVFGVMRDKDIVGMLSELRPLVTTLHLCAPATERAATTQALEQLAINTGYQRVTTHTSVLAATTRACMRGAAIICGSFHVAEEALPYFNQ